MRPGSHALLRTALLALCLTAAACGDGPSPSVAGPAEPTAPRSNDLWPGAPAYQPDTTYGVVATELGDAERDTLVRMVRRSGVGWVRLTAYWPSLQPYGPGFERDSLDKLKRQVKAVRDQGLRVFLSLERTPGWARMCQPTCGDWRYPPHDNFWNSWQNYTHDLVDSLSVPPYDVQA